MADPVHTPEIRVVHSSIDPIKGLKLEGAERSTLGKPREEHACKVSVPSTSQLTPAQRWRWEWSQPGFAFPQEPNGACIDLKRSLAPSGHFARFYRWFVLVWAVQVLLAELAAYPAHNRFIYMGYLTHWGHTLTAVYFLLSFACSSHPHVRTKLDAQAVECEEAASFVSVSRNRFGILVHTTWNVYAVVAPMQLAICSMYWILIANGPPTYISVMEHGGFAILIWWDGLMVGQVPLRAKQMLFVIAMSSLYFGWTILDAVCDIGNGEWGPDTDDALYPILNWKTQSTLAALVSCAALFILTPACFIVCWLASLASWNRTDSAYESSIRRMIVFDGSSRYTTTKLTFCCDEIHRESQSHVDGLLRSSSSVTVTDIEPIHNTSLRALTLWQRWRWEWAEPFYSLMEPSGEYLDSSACFAPERPFRATFWVRLMWFTASLHVLAVDLWSYPPHNLHIYMGYLTHWGHALTNVYWIFAILCSTKTNSRERILECPGPLICWMWGLYSTIAPLGLAITFLYWIGVTGNAAVGNHNGPIGYVAIMEHGGLALLVLIDGLWVSHIPVRAKHLVLLLAICASYLVWSVLDAVYDLGSGDWGPAYDDDAFYPVLNWKHQTTLAAIASSVAMVVVAPTFFYGCWMLGLVSTKNRSHSVAGFCGFAYDGSSRVKHGAGTKDDNGFEYRCHNDAEHV